MAYKVRPDGSIEVDSLEEAIALSKRLAAAPESRGRSAPQVQQSPAPTLPAAPRATQQAPSQTKMKGWEMFAGSLPENQRRVLAAIRAQGRLSLEELQEVLGVTKNQGVTGVLSGIVKNANRCGVAPTDVLIREAFGDGVTYLPGPVLRDAKGFDLPKEASTKGG